MISKKNRKAQEFKTLAHLIYEAGVLFRVRRSGWWLAGVPSPESVAEHSFRTAVIAFVLAHLEGCRPERAAAMALFHDLHESRVLDMHKVGQGYADWEQVELRAIQEQLAALPEDLGKAVRGYKERFQHRTDREATVARDADHLECLVRAREYQSQGQGQVADWIENSRKRLRTGSARRLARELLRTDPQEWWVGLKKSIRET